MDRKQVIQVLNSIQHSYPGKFNISDAAGLVNEWSKLLLPYEAEVVERNLQRHIKASPFPPSISDLVKQQGTPDRVQAIPDVEETKRMLDSMKQPEKISAEEKKRIKQYQAQIRKTLGIER